MDKTPQKEAIAWKWLPRAITVPDGEATVQSSDSRQKVAGLRRRVAFLKHG
jgi:hypothetical protein